MRRAHAERGSAYLLALLVLLILTIVGLAATLSTESEAQLGKDDERSTNTFYSTDTGIAIATAKALVVPDLSAARIELVVPTADADLHVRNRLDISALVPIEEAPCDLCQVNQDAPFSQIHHALTVTSTRIAWTGDPERPPELPTPHGRESVSTMVTFQPWRLDTLAAVRALTADREQAAGEGL